MILIIALIIWALTMMACHLADCEITRGMS